MPTITNLIYSATNIPSTYTRHTHDLSVYAGAPFYIAFHYNAIDEFVIKLDDVVLLGGVGEPPYTDVDMGDLPLCNYPTLVNNPAHGLSGVAWLGANVTPETSPNYGNTDAVAR